MKRILSDRQGWKGWIFRTVRDILSAYLAVIIWKGTYNIFGFSFFKIDSLFRSLLIDTSNLVEICHLFFGWVNYSSSGWLFRSEYIGVINILREGNLFKRI
jgi:hypothetical protein